MVEKAAFKQLMGSIVSLAAEAERGSRWDTPRPVDWIHFLGKRKSCSSILMGTQESGLDFRAWSCSSARLP